MESDCVGRLGSMHRIFAALLEFDACRPQRPTFVLVEIACRDLPNVVTRSDSGCCNLARVGARCERRDRRGGARGHAPRRPSLLTRTRTLCYIDGVLKIALAEAEAQAAISERALAYPRRSAGDLAHAHRLSRVRCFDLHRVRGELLLKRDPANPAPAEDAFLSAIAVAREQGTRKLRLRPRWRSRNSINRPAARSTPTPSSRPRSKAFRRRRKCRRSPRRRRCSRRSRQTDEVKAEAAHRQRLTQLHVAYGNALLRRAALARRRLPEPSRRARQLAQVTRTRPNDWRPTTACGSAASCEASCRR